MCDSLFLYLFNLVALNGRWWLKKVVDVREVAVVEGGGGSGGGAEDV